MTITNLLSTILFASLDLLAAIAYMEKEFDTSSSISGVKKGKNYYPNLCDSKDVDKS